MSSSDPESLSRNPRIRTLSYTEESISSISELLDAETGLADFRLPGSVVYQMTVEGTNGRPAAMVTLWPGIRRVDVVSGPATIVFTDVQTVDLVPDVEVQFRRTAKECLILAKNGQVIVRA